MAILETFTVPHFHLPFRNSKHPEGRRANQEATEWALRHGLIHEAAEDFAGIGFGHLSARVEHAASYEDVLLLSQWMAWSFVLDDQHDHLIRSGDVAAWLPVTRAIDTYLTDGDAGAALRSCDNPLVAGFIDLCDRILDGMTEPLRARYRLHVPAMLRSLDQEAVNRRAPGQPAVDDYVLMRRHSSQLLPMMDMVEAAHGIALPPRVHQDPAFRELMWSAIDVVSWGNDIFSLRKEYSCGDNNNLASLLAWWHGWPLERAVADVEERIHERVEDFLALSRDLPRILDALDVKDPVERADAERCVRGYEDWMTGADMWQRYECTRYDDERFVAGLESAYTRPDLVSAA